MKREKKRSKSFFKDNLREGVSYIKESRTFIYIAVAIFLLFVIVGFVLPTPSSIENLITEFIKDLLAKTEGMSWAELTGYIFLNNVKSSFFGMIFGVVFGVFSLITVIVNGYILGFVSAKVVQAQGLPMLWRLFPHGIFELPAVLISIGLGLKIGSFIFYKDKMKSLKRFFSQSMKVFFFIVIPLLLIAAVIESILIVFIN